MFDAVLAVITTNDPHKKEVQDNAERIDAKEEWNDKKACCPTCCASFEKCANDLFGSNCCAKWAYAHVLGCLMLVATINCLSLSVQLSGDTPMVGWYSIFVPFMLACFAFVPCFMCFARCFPGRKCPPTYFAKLYGVVEVDFSTEI